MLSEFGLLFTFRFREHIKPQVLAQKSLVILKN